ncbi:MAG TPA: NCS2 family permease [Candidatus Ozemobacteraceae bacterium]|nr:NCS2 family permease [Candidatus Ozemobacteraceae bacterium]
MLERFFSLKANETDVRTEILAGITTFMTMAYILAVNPMILENAGMSFAGVLTATVLVASFSSILMGLVANLPFALAPGMGINAFFTFSMVIGMKIPWQTALGAVFISGLIFLLMTIFRLREAIVRAIPHCVRLGVAAGIGLFLCLLALKSAGFIVANPATLVSFGGFNAQTIVFLIGLALTIFFEQNKIPGSLLLGIAFTTVLAVSHGRIWPGQILVQIPSQLYSTPDFSSVFLQLDIRGALSFGIMGAVFTLLFTDMFDSISTFLGVASVANMVDETGEPRNFDKALLVDAVSTTLSGLVGSSSGTTYVESAAGVEQGGRTGLTAVVCGLLFLPFLWLAPMLQMIPACAIAPALLLVGFFMLRAIAGVDWKDYEVGLPAFAALILIPFTFSISQGISWGLVLFLLLKVYSGKISETSPVLWVITFFAGVALYLA